LTHAQGGANHAKQNEYLWRHLSSSGERSRDEKDNTHLVPRSFYSGFAGACSIPPSSDPAAPSAEPFPIIDMHMHTYQWNKYGDPPQPNLITGNVPEARTDADAVGAYIAEMVFACDSVQGDY
jgi:hypothetical protein